jgi:hypothetical protein
MNEKSVYFGSLARFYGNTSYALEVISESRLAFVRVSNLNDPFDPYFYFETDFGFDYKRLFEYVRVFHPNDFGWFIQELPPARWKERIATINRYLQYTRNTTFMTCFIAPSEHMVPQNNLLMWAHYGRGHRGAMIEFDKKRLDDSIVAVNSTAETPTEHTGQVMMKVQYQDSAPIITPRDIYEFYQESRNTFPDNTKLMRKFRSFLYVKSKVWSYENEWRMLWRNDETKEDTVKMFINEDTIKAIYIGMNADHDTRNNVTIAARKTFPRSTVFLAKKKHGKFGLEFEII